MAQVIDFEPPDFQPGEYRVLMEGLKVYEAPTVESTELASLEYGEVIETARNVSCVYQDGFYWYQILYEDELVWVQHFQSGCEFDHYLVAMLEWTPDANKSKFKTVKIEYDEILVELEALKHQCQKLRSVIMNAFKLEEDQTDDTP